VERSRVVRSKQLKLSQILLPYTFDMKKLQNLIIFLLPFITFGFYQFLVIEDYGFLFIVGQEGVLDKLQFPMYLIVSVLTFLMFKKSSGFESVVILLFSIGILLIAFEEISWGQTYFNFSTPDYLNSRNLQQETNIHNLDYIQNFTHLGYIAVGLFFSFGRILSSIHQLAPVVQKIIPNWKFIGFNLPLAIYYYLFFYTNYQKNIIEYVAQEYFEFMFSLGLLIFIFSSWRSQRTLA
jgi:hypothetical protein